MLVAEIITQEERLKAIAPLWKRLQDEKGATPFTDYDWVSIWWEELGRKRNWQLFIVTAWDNNALVGVLPLAIIQKAGIKILFPAGAEAFYYGTCLSICDDVTEKLWQAVFQSRTYHFAWITDCPDGSSNARALANIACQERVIGSYQLTSRPDEGLDLEGVVEKKVRSDIRRRITKFERDGGAGYRLCNDEESRHKAIEAFVCIKTNWAIKNGKRGLFDTPLALPFLHKLTQERLEKKKLVLGMLMAKDVPVAYHVCFMYRTTLYAYAMTYDPAWGKYSPGTILKYGTISHFKGQMDVEINFMQGDDKFKAPLANKRTVLFDYSFSPTLFGKLLVVLYRIRVKMRERRNKGGSA